MTVSELITELNKFPGSLNVKIGYFSTDYGCEEIAEIAEIRIGWDMDRSHHDEVVISDGVDSHGL